MLNRDSQDTPITTVITQLGIVQTVGEAEDAFVETVARRMVVADMGADRREEDDEDQLALGYALQKALGITTGELFARLGARITATHAKFTAQVQR